MGLTLVLRGPILYLCIVSKSFGAIGAIRDSWSRASSPRPRAVISAGSGETLSED